MKEIAKRLLKNFLIVIKKTAKSAIFLAASKAVQKYLLKPALRKFHELCKQYGWDDDILEYMDCVYFNI